MTVVKIFIKFWEETKAPHLINDPFFRQIKQIDNNTYEVQSSKKTIELNLPMQIGFFVYQYAKLHMLQFYFLDKYLDSSDFQYCETDTDSAFIALSGPSVESLVKPDLKQEFLKAKPNRFPKTNSIEHKAYDKRTWGLFKEEWFGEGIIGLNSKTYYCFGLGHYSCLPYQMQLTMKNIQMYCMKFKVF